MKKAFIMTAISLAAEALGQTTTPIDLNETSADGSALTVGIVYNIAGTWTLSKFGV